MTATGLSRRPDRADFAERQHHRHGRRQHELEPPELFRDEISAGQGLSRHPGQSRRRRQGASWRDRARQAFPTSPSRIDMVEIFRKSEAAPAIVDEAIALKIPVVWMQLGVRHDAAAAKAQAAGLTVIMDRCPKIEFGRLGGELSWSGVDSGIISSKRRQAPKPPVQETRPRSNRSFRSRLWLRDALHPCRRRARSGHRRAHHADLPDRVLCIRRRRSGRVPVQPAQLWPCL